MTSDVVGFLLYYVFYLYWVKSDHSFLGQDWPGQDRIQLGSGCTVAFVFIERWVQRETSKSFGSKISMLKLWPTFSRPSRYQAFTKRAARDFEGETAACLSCFSCPSRYQAFFKRKTWSVVRSGVKAECTNK